jgi:hypothetical protein
MKGPGARGKGQSAGSIEYGAQKTEDRCQRPSIVDCGLRIAELMGERQRL